LIVGPQAGRKADACVENTVGFAGLRRAGVELQSPLATAGVGRLDRRELNQTLRLAVFSCALEMRGAGKIRNQFTAVPLAGSWANQFAPLWAVVDGVDHVAKSWLAAQAKCKRGAVCS